MAARDLCDRVRRYYVDIDEGRVRDALAIFHESATYERAGTSPLRGARAIEDFYLAVRPVGGSHEIDRVVQDGSVVLVEGRFTSVEGEIVGFADVFEFDEVHARRRRTYTMG